METSKSQRVTDLNRSEMRGRSSNSIPMRFTDKLNQRASTQSIWILHTIVINDSMIAHNWDSSNTSCRVVAAPKMK